MTSSLDTTEYEVTFVLAVETNDSVYSLLSTVVLATSVEGAIEQAEIILSQQMAGRLYRGLFFHSITDVGWDERIKELTLRDELKREQEKVRELSRLYIDTKQRLDSFMKVQWEGLRFDVLQQLGIDNMGLDSHPEIYDIFTPEICLKLDAEINSQSLRDELSGRIYDLVESESGEFHHIYVQLQDLAKNLNLGEEDSEDV